VCMVGAGAGGGGAACCAARACGRISCVFKTSPMPTLDDEQESGSIRRHTTGAGRAPLCGEHYCNQDVMLSVPRPPGAMSVAR